MITIGGVDAILATQLVVAWAGEARCQPKRLGWWDTDLIDEAGGGDLLARLAPRTHVWASLAAVREAARRVDSQARAKHGEPDLLRTIFFLGFELDEQVADRLAALKRGGQAPETALPLPVPLHGAFDKAKVVAAFAKAGKSGFEKVPPLGRQLKGSAPVAPDEMVERLVAALLPLADEYPLPFYRVPFYRVPFYRVPFYRVKA